MLFVILFTILVITI